MPEAFVGRRALRKRLAAGSVAVMLAASAGSLGVLRSTPVAVAANSSDDAVAYQVNPAHTGAQPTDALSPPLHTRWSLDLGGKVSYPLIVGGRVYAVALTANGSGGALYAFNGADGTAAWPSINLGGLGSLAYDAGKLFVVDNSGGLRAIDSATGAPVWSLPQAGSSPQAAPVAANGAVYIAVDRFVHAFSEVDGTALWSSPSTFGSSPISLAANSGGIYADYTCGGTYDFSPANGAIIWNVPHTSSCASGNTSVVAGGRDYVRNSYGNEAFDAGTGKTSSEFSSVTPPAIDGALSFHSLAFSNSPPAAYTLQAEDVGTGRIRWTFTGDGHLDTAPIVANRVVYVGSATGTLFALDEASGAVLWQGLLGSPILGTELGVFGQTPITGLNAGDGLLAVPATNSLVVLAPGGVANGRVAAQNPCPSPGRAHEVATAATADEAVAFQTDAGHSGGQPSDSLTPPLTKRWTYDLPGASLFPTVSSASYPLIASGKIYFTASNPGQGSRLFGFDAATGLCQFQPIDLGGFGPDQYVAYDAGKLFEVNDNGVVRSFDANTGAPLWIDGPGYLSSRGLISPPVAAGGAVALSSGGGVRSVSEADGSQVFWNQAIMGGQTSSPVLTASSVYSTYMAGACAQTYDLNRTTGAVNWHYGQQCSGGGGETPALYNGVLYGRFQPDIMFDATSGTKLSGSFSSLAAPAFDGGRGFYLPAQDSSLEAHGAGGGGLLWSFSGDGTLTTPPVAGNGFVYIGSRSGNVYGVNESTGQQAWSDPIGSGFRSQDFEDGGYATGGLAIGEGLLAAPASGRLAVYGPAPWTPPTGTAPAPAAPPVVSSVDPPTGPTAGGTAITIHGQDFQASGTTQVLIGGVVATGVTVSDSGTIHATAGAHGPGTVAITVRNPDGQVGTSDLVYTYVAPSLLVGAVGGDNALWMNRDRGGWGSLGGYLIGAPAVASVPGGSGNTPLFVATGGDHDLWVRSLSSSWQRLDSQAGAYCIDNPGAALVGSTLTVGCQGGDHGLWTNSGQVTAGSLPSFSVGNWKSQGGSLRAGPAVANVPNRGLEIMTVNSDNSVSEYYGGGAHAGGFGCHGHPSLATNPAGNHSYFACHGLDDALWTSENTGSGWMNTGSLGGIVIDGPAIAADGQGATFYVEGGDRAVWEHNGVGWMSDGGVVSYGTGAAAVP